MIPYSQSIWAGLEFRKPMMLRNIEPLSEEQMLWIPGPERKNIAWQLWHITEVEDNWVRSMITNEKLRFPFNIQMRKASEEDYPPKVKLIEYFNEVREISKYRLEVASESDYTRKVEDPDFGKCTVLDIWMGVVTSFAWHAGQIALTAKLLPDTPVTTMKFDYWKDDKWQHNV